MKQTHAEDKWSGVEKAMPFMVYAKDGEQVYDYLRIMVESSDKNAFEAVVLDNKIWLIKRILTTENEGDVEHLRGQIDAVLEIIVGGKQ